jgi:hypothetical protein
MPARTPIGVHGAAFQPQFPADFPELPGLAGIRNIARDLSGSFFSTPKIRQRCSGRTRLRFGGV